MNRFNILSRRNFFKTAAAAGAAILPGYALAEELILTPRQTEGPFYPDKMPLDLDNNLIVINDNLTKAVGEITQLTGRVLDRKGNPIKKAKVEIWQVDAFGRYIHTKDVNRGKHDGNFQGYGAFETDSKGAYAFRTIKPVAYTGRAPHIHFSVTAKGQPEFTTQCYVKGAKENRKDFILQRVKNDKARESLIVDFKPIADSKIGELAANFDIVLRKETKQ